MYAIYVYAIEYVFNNVEPVEPFRVSLYNYHLTRVWGIVHFNLMPIHPASRGVAAHTAGLFRSVRGAKGGFPLWGLPKLRIFTSPPVGAPQAREFSLSPPVGAPQAREF